ncbi:MAG: xanthine dehydrogenase family protein molybdopterin-binding subunit [Xanthobacteraceae bacterium]
MSSHFKGRREDRRLLTGTGCFTADWNLPGQVHAAFLRSDRAHARIRSIDTSAARALPGVLAVLSGDDIKAAGYKSLPSNAPGPGYKGSAFRAPERHGLAQGRVRFAGEAVALAVAETAAIAQDACELIEVDYEDLPVVTTPAAAIAPNAVQLHDSVPNNTVLEFGYGDEAATEAAMAKAVHKVTLTLDAQRISGAPMEPKACTVAYDPATDSFDVYMQNQGMADIQVAFAQVTGLPAERFRLHTRDVGGGFGVRNEVYPENVAVLLAAKTVGRPVQWVGTRSESLANDHQGRGAVLTGTLGLDADGNFVALRVQWLVNMGAYCSKNGPFINTMASPRSMSNNIYKVPALFGLHKLILTNCAPGTAYRGAGRPNVSYLWERLVDEAARVTGVGRVRLRRRNMLPKSAFPYKTPTAFTYDCADAPTLLSTALQAADWDKFPARRREAKRRGKLRGIGLALFIEPSGGVGKEEIAIRFGRNGEISLYTLAGPTGQSHETVHTEIVANMLGVDPETVNLHASDPSGPKLTGTGTFGSRSLLSHGVALHHGALEVIKKGIDLAAQSLEVSAADVEFKEGTFVVKGTDHRIGLTELVKKHAGPGPHPLDAQTTAQVSAAFPSGAHISEVEVDPDTGKIDILRYIAVDDCGVIYNHEIVEGQLHGGLMQGIGQVLGEHCNYDRDSGQFLTGSFMDYYMPRAEVLPELTLLDRPVPSPANPLGAKGAGEAGTTGSVPCLANAVHDALAEVGVRHIEMPYTPARVWKAIREAAG